MSGDASIDLHLPHLPHVEPFNPGGLLHNPLHKSQGEKVKAAQKKGRDAVAAAGGTKQDQQAVSDKIAKDNITTDGGIANLVKALSANLDTGSLPPQVISMTNGTPSDQQIEKARVLYNASTHTGKPVADKAGMLILLKAQSPAAMAALSQTVAGGPSVGTNYNLGPGFGNKQVFISDAADNALSQYWPTAAANMHGIVTNAAMSGVPHQLLVAASEANRALLTAGTTNHYKAKGSTKDGNPTGLDPVGAAVGEYDLAQRLKDNVAKYGDYTLALLATRDPGAADKIRNGVPLSDAEKQGVRQLFTDAAYNPKSMEALGLSIDPEKYAYVVTQAGGDGSSGSGASTIKLPNQKEVAEGLTTVFKAWFQRNPTAAELAAFTGQMNAAVTAAQGGGAQKGTSNPFQRSADGTSAPATVEDAPSLQTAAGDFARQSGDYKELFGHMPGNLDETGYAQQFSTAAQQLFGTAGAGEADAIRAGMKTGDTHTTEGVLAGQKKAFDNSTFVERMAQAAQVVGRMV